MNPYPLLFHPILKERVWGGRALAALGKPLPTGRKIGESWEVADLPESVAPGGAGRSIIANGSLASRTLREAITEHRDLIMGDAKLTSDGGFPLLIKYLDAQENLSVQVHPDERYAKLHPDSHLKSEAWVVIAARPGAVIYKGVKPGVTREQFADDIRCGAAVDDLIAVPAKQGDCHYLPSGTCHALGAGVLVAEVQTPSDTTFRVFDWGRPPASGRELHIEQAMQCIDFSSTSPDPHRPQNPPTPIEANGVRTSVLSATEYFIIERVDALEEVDFEAVTSGLPEIWMMIAGAGTIATAGLADIHLSGGTTILLPALLEGSRLRLRPNSWALRVKLPSPLRGMIARR